MIFNMDVPIEYIGAAGLLILVLFFGFFYFFNYWMDIRNKHPELHVLQTSRKKPFPSVIAMVDPSDKMLLFNGVLEKPTDIKLMKKDYGLLMDPHQATKMPKSRLEDGTGLFMYGAGFHFPISPNGARTIVQFVERIRKDHPTLNFIRDDIVLIELFTKSGTDLKADIINVLKMYPLEKLQDTTVNALNMDISNIANISKEDLTKYLESEEQTDLKITVDDIAETVEDIKGETKGWKVHPGFFSMHDGISLLPIGTMSSDMTRLETVTKMNTANDFMKAPDPWMATLKFIALIGGGLLLAYMIISAMKPE